MGAGKPLKAAVMGAGAVGCYFGGMLARAGHEVTFIARPQHVEAIRRDGLRMETKTFDERVRLNAVTEASGAQGADLVLFCVKSMATACPGNTVRSRSALSTPFCRHSTSVSGRR